MARVFLSYARQDAARARPIALALERAGHTVWWDEKIRSGGEFSEEIEQALAAADAIVVLWSQSSIDSAWVRDEASEGRDTGRLVPVLLDQCRPPMGFRQYQTTDLSHWSGRGRPKPIDELIAVVAAKQREPKDFSPAQKEVAPRPGRSRVVAAIAAVAIATAGTLAALYFSGGQRTEAPTAAPSVALLPFTADAADPDLRELASAMHDALVHTLSQGAFAVSALDSLPKGSDSLPDFVISGVVSGTPDKVTSTVRMDETAHHYVVFSHQFEAERNGRADLPERVGAQMAAQLSWTAPLLMLERRHPSDPAITAALLQSSSTGLAGGDRLHDFETARRLAIKAPDSPLAQSNLAIDTAFALDQIPRDQRAPAIADARRAAGRSLQLAPEYEGGYIASSLLLNSLRFGAAEKILRAGMHANADVAWTNWFLSGLYNEVGRNRESLELARLSLAHDPYMLWKIARALQMLDLTGQTDDAARLYQQSSRWWPGSQGIIGYRLNGAMERGDFRAVQQFADESAMKARLGPVLAAINSGSVAAMHSACSAADESARVACMLALARSGDLDSAFVLAGQIYPSRRGRNPVDDDRIWLDNPDVELLAYITGPSAAPLRRDPRYLALADRVGLLAYWRSGRLPDFCQPPKPEPEPLCGQLRSRRR
jgi:TolB-like protein